MTLLVLGLVLFLGVHSVRVVPDRWRVYYHRPPWRRAVEGCLLAVVAGWAGLGSVGSRPGPSRPCAVVDTAGGHAASGLAAGAVGVCAVGGSLCAAQPHLMWAVLSVRAVRQRDDAAALAPGPHRHSSLRATVITGVLGVAAWAGFAVWGHSAWIGVSLLGCEV